jgi:hypothetical protein
MLCASPHLQLRLVPVRKMKIRTLNIQFALPQSFRAIRCVCASVLRVLSGVLSTLGRKKPYGARYVFRTQQAVVDLVSKRAAYQGRLKHSVLLRPLCVARDKLLLC